MNITELLNLALDSDCDEIIENITNDIKKIGISNQKKTKKQISKEKKSIFFPSKTSFSIFTIFPVPCVG